MDSALEALLASNDFEEAEYDRTMAKIFGTAYYEASPTPSIQTLIFSAWRAGLRIRTVVGFQ